MAHILDGKQMAREIEQEIQIQADQFVQQTGVKPCLAAVLVGNDPASQVYVRNKQKACQRVGIESQLHRLEASISATELSARVAQLNADPLVHGILIQLPLPKQIAESAILDQVHPLKDVDAFHPDNVGRLVQGRPRFVPCTPHGVQQMLHRAGVEVAGKHVVVVGRSDIVGKPLALLLMQRDSTCGPTAANASVTICHSQSRDLATIARSADVLVAAIGRPAEIRADMVKSGAAVIDVGINRTESGLVGDVDFEAVKEVAGHISPVPGGVGPLTISMLLHNTISAATLQHVES
jgi:methylenetetrahydrofolate dehydrogenase (NADP+)/methenyltetrahydrofolate cyclohydrolase